MKPTAREKASFSRGSESLAPPGIGGLAPSYFDLVMATGIVSLAAQLEGYYTVARFLFYFNVLAYILLITLNILRAALYPGHLVGDFIRPSRSPGFLTFVAGTAMLGSQFLDVGRLPGAAMALFGVAVVSWVVLIYGTFMVITLRRHKPSINRAISGGWLMIVVGTESVAILAAELADRLPFPAEHVLFAAMVLFFAGCMWYIIVITLIVYRLSFFRLRAEEFTPTYWINMGAVAIIALAGSMLLSREPLWHFIGNIAPFLKGFTLFFWSVATWWVPFILLLGFWRHIIKRLPFRYNVQYWSMVFPMGMYAVSTIEMAYALNLPFLHGITEGVFIAALVAWVVVLFGLVRALTKRLVRGKTPMPR